MGRILIELDLLSLLRGILWVPHRQQANGQNNYGENSSSCARNSLGPKNKYMATTEDQYVDNQKRVLPIKKKATIISSEFSSPKQLEKIYASSIDKISSPQNYVKQTASHFSAIVSPPIVPADDVREGDSTQN